MFASAPMVIQETLLFPYINGADFIRRFKAHEQGKLPFDSLPMSTKQLMHDSAYFGKHGICRAHVVLPAIPGTVDENNFGEFGTRLFLYQHTRDQDRPSARRTAGRRPIRAGEDAPAATHWSGPRCGTRRATPPNSCRRSIRSCVKRFNVRPRVTGERRHFDTDKRTVELDVRDIAASRSCCTSTCRPGVDQGAHRLLEGEGRAAVTLPRRDVG